MGIFSFLAGGKPPLSFEPVPVHGTATATGIISPWSSGDLSKVVWSDVFGTTAQHITRGEAMSIPAVQKARGVLISLIADKPLKAYKGDTLVGVQPTFLYRTDGTLSPTQRMAYTLDDLIFSGMSLWYVERGAAGQITSAFRVPFEMWEIDANNRILINKTPVDAQNVLLFVGPNDGLLNSATRTLRGAAALETAWIGRAQSPIPAIELHEKEASGVTPEEAQEVVDAWAAARKDPNGAVAFTPAGIEVHAYGTNDADLFTEGRNSIRVDIANFFNLPTALLDGSVATASLTYSTQEGKRNEVFDYTIPYWIGVIEGRLSQDDVVPAGQRVTFDFSSILTNTEDPTGPVTED